MSNTLNKEAPSVASYNGWEKPFFDKIRDVQWFQHLKRKVTERRAIETVYPAPEAVFAAFKKCPYDEFKVLILGQDPYHTPGVADGLAFSTQQIVRPPSLGYIFQEVNRDLYDNQLNFKDSSNDLTEWAQQGVLLLNTCLTVKQGEPNSHADIGWDTFIDILMKKTLYMVTDPFVVMLWGKQARAYKKHFFGKGSGVLILEAPHPMSEGYGFNSAKRERFHGCAHFSKCNEFLQSKGRTPVDWRIHKSAIFQQYEQG